MKKVSSIPDWIPPKELLLVWPENLLSGLGNDLTSFYKRLIKTINDVPIRILYNYNKPKIAINDAITFTKINTGDIWLRDFMPIAGRGKNAHYVKFTYSPSYLLGKDVFKELGNTSAKRLKCCFSERNLVFENIILDGGNFISNGTSTAITTNRIISDNEHLSIDEIKLLIKDRLGIHNLIILPVEPGDITGHVDGMVRFINESLVVVGDYPPSYSIGKKFMDRIAKSLIQKKLKVIRILNDIPALDKRSFPSAVGNYINYLRIGNTIYLPVYKRKELLNKKALKVYESLGLNVIPIYSDELAEYGGVLNCITWHYY